MKITSWIKNAISGFHSKAGSAAPPAWWFDEDGSIRISSQEIMASTIQSAKIVNKEQPTLVLRHPDAR